jgi:hypothetical protein
MALKELESPFYGLDKEAVQEWLIHPVTQQLARVQEEKSNDLRDRIVAGVRLGTLDVGSGRLALLADEALLKLLQEADSYAK